MADVRISWLQLDTNATPCDVKVSWVQFDTAATTCDVKVSWVQFDTAATTCDVKVSWLEFASNHGSIITDDPIIYPGAFAPLSRPSSPISPPFKRRTRRRREQEFLLL